MPLLKKGAANQADKPMSVSRAAIINISSVLGSITQNDSGGFYPYRCSKVRLYLKNADKLILNNLQKKYSKIEKKFVFQSALNAATKSMSIDLREYGILAISLHPGWVKTEMGGQKAPLEIDTSVENILTTLQNLTAEKTGSFIQYDGTLLPW